jgi:hypothetical protein
MSVSVIFLGYVFVNLMGEGWRKKRREVAPEKWG